MAIGGLNDMTQFNKQFYGGFINRVQTKLDVFNQSSLGTMNLSALFHKGLYTEEAFFTNTMTLRDRDPTSTSVVVPDSIGSDSLKRVKVYKFAAGSQTYQSFRNQGLSLDEIGFQMGVHTGDNILLNWRESAVSSLAGAFDQAAFLPGGGDDLVLDISQDLNGGIFDVNTMIQAMPLMGDASSRLKAVVMHSHVYWPMVAAASTNLATPSTADFAVSAGLPATLGLPIIVVDSDALVISGGGGDGQDAYRTFILTQGAVTVEESEAPDVRNDENLLLENSAMIYKAEIAYTLGVKGISYTGVNDHPSNPELAAAASWTKKYASKRDLMGVCIKSVAIANDGTP